MEEAIIQFKLNLVLKLARFIWRACINNLLSTYLFNYHSDSLITMDNYNS